MQDRHLLLVHKSVDVGEEHVLKVEISELRSYQHGVCKPWILRIQPVKVIIIQGVQLAHLYLLTTDINSHWVSLGCLSDESKGSSGIIETLEFTKEASLYKVSNVDCDLLVVKLSEHNLSLDHHLAFVDKVDFVDIIALIDDQRPVVEVLTFQEADDLEYHLLWGVLSSSMAIDDIEVVLKLIYFVLKARCNHFSL